MAALRPLQQQVRDHGLWAAHLKPELGGQGYGQVKLAQLNEIVGRSRWAPSVFGSHAPDSCNAEIQALFGTPEQKTRYLEPLLAGEITSCYSMTEPQGGSDPGLFVTRAERDGDSWVINGEKLGEPGWSARHASSACSALGPNGLHKAVSWICIQRGGRHIGHNVGPPLDNTISPVTSKPNRW
jgi:acyl-CoA dehydrogenase